jgi:hypothetical protein
VLALVIASVEASSVTMKRGVCQGLRARVSDWPLAFGSGVSFIAARTLISQRIRIENRRGPDHASLAGVFHCRNEIIQLPRVVKQ